MTRHSLAAKDTYGTAKNILEAAAKASGLQWSFRGKLHGCGMLWQWGMPCSVDKRKTGKPAQLVPIGPNWSEDNMFWKAFLPTSFGFERVCVSQTQGPIFTADWFGPRETWVMEVQDNDCVAIWSPTLGYAEYADAIMGRCNFSHGMWRVDAFTLRGSDARVGHWAWILVYLSGSKISKTPTTKNVGQDRKIEVVAVWHVVVVAKPRFCPFPLLYRGNELDSEPDIRNDIELLHATCHNLTDLKIPSHTLNISPDEP